MENGKKIIIFILVVLLASLVLIGGGCGDEKNGDENGDKNGSKEDCEISWQCTDWSDYMCGSKWRFCRDINECKEYYTDAERPEDYKSISSDEAHLYDECSEPTREKCKQLDEEARQASDCYFDCSDECVFINYDQHDACRAQCSKTCEKDEAQRKRTRCAEEQILKAVECNAIYQCGYHVSQEMNDARDEYNLDRFNQAIKNEIQRRIQEKKDREGWD